MIHTYVIVIVVMLLLSALFSGMETAFISSNRLKLEIDRKQSRTFDFIAGVFTRHSSQYITTMLVGNNITLVVYSMFVSKLYVLLSGSQSVLVETLLATIVVIFLAEFIPKALVLKSPNFYFRNLAWLMFVFYILLYPIAMFATGLSIGIMRLFGRKVKLSDAPISVFARQDLAHFVEDNSTEQTHADGEIQMFRNVLEFPDLRVRDCMVPRIDIEAVERHDDISLLRGKFESSKYSRILVYDGTVDNIVGYVNIKSLFKTPSKIDDVLISIDYVPETLAAQELLTTFIKKHTSLVVVLDEFGVTSGIVSLEDLLEEIFGEIEDEHDSQDLVEKSLDGGELLLSCRLEVDYLNDKYGLGIPVSDEYDTLAGYIIYVYGGIPRSGEELNDGKLSIRVVKSTSSRVLLARVKQIKT